MKYLNEIFKHAKMWKYSSISGETAHIPMKEIQD